MLVLDYDQLVEVSRSVAKADEERSSLLAVEDGGGATDWGVAKACVEAMGPNGEGFVAVRGMRNYASLRNRLLRLAPELALMPNAERAAVLKEHGLGTDVPLKEPGRSVSSFAAQLRFESLPELNKIGPTLSDGHSGLEVQWSSPGDSLYGDLGSLFKQLGMCMVEVGLLIARLCDATRSRGGLREARLEQTILESGTAKGRLIHYHSFLEQEILSSLQKDLKKGQKQNKNASKGRNADSIPKLPTDSGSTMWQQWHCDYGIFTVLTSPLFLKPTEGVPLEPPDVAAEGGCCLENEPSWAGFHSEHDNSRERKENPQWTSSQQPFSFSHGFMDLNSSIQECLPPDGHSSLRVMDTYGRTSSVVVPSDYLIVQVGEAAQLLSGGELVARAHCVTRSTAGKDVSRETMAVFLQPAWEKCLSLPLGTLNTQRGALEAGGIATNLETHIPLLASRWKDGYTFAEFSKETTRQYYGADGRQSRR